MSKSTRKKPRQGAYSSQPERDSLYHYVYSFGFAILSSIANFVFLWPQSHLWALLFAAAAFSLASVYELRNQRKIWSVGVPILLFALAFIAYLDIGPNPPNESEVIGALQPGNEATPPNPCDRNPDAATLMKLLVGSNAFAVLPVLSKWTAIKVGACDVLILESEGSNLAVSAQLYGAEGNFIARIESNKFTAINGSDTYIQRHGDLSTFIVKRKLSRFFFWPAEKEILYVRFLNSKTVRVRGEFGCPNHRLV